MNRSAVPNYRATNLSHLKINSPRLIVLLGIALIVGLGIIRALILFAPNAPSGTDAGNWLAFGSQIRPGLAYPPLVPALFAALVSLTGAPLATAIAGAITTTVPALALLVLLTWGRRPGIGIVSALAVAGSRAIGETAAWGGYQQPIALALALVALVGLITFLRTGDRRGLATFALGFAGVVATSHLVAIPTVGAIVLGLGGAIFLDRGRTIRRTIPVLGFTVLPFILLAPTYLALFSTLNNGVGGTASIGPDDISAALGILAPLYLLAPVLLPLGALLACRRQQLWNLLGPREQILITTATLAAMAWICTILVLRQPRLLYDLEVLGLFDLAVGAVLVLTLIRSSRLAVSWLGVLGAIVVISLGISYFPAAVDHYRVITAPRYAALEWLSAHRPAQASSILVADANGFIVGWWAEGLIGQEVLFASNLGYLRFESERERATLANSLLYHSGFPDRASSSTIQKAGVQYVFLPSARAFGIEPANPPAGWSAVFVSGDTIVLAPSGT